MNRLLHGTMLSRKHWSRKYSRFGVMLTPVDLQRGSLHKERQQPSAHPMLVDSENVLRNRTMYERRILAWRTTH